MKLTIGKKIGMLLAVVLTLLVISSVLVYEKASQIREQQSFAATVWVPTIVLNKELQRELNQMLNKSRQAILASGDAAAFEKAKGLFELQRDLCKKDMEKLDALAPRWVLQENHDRLARVKPNLDTLFRAEEEAIDMAGSGRREDAAKASAMLMQNGTVPSDAIKKTMEEMAESMENLLANNQVRINAESQTMVWMLWGMTIFCLILALVAGSYLGRGVTQATGAVLERAEAIAEGDLTGSEIAISSNDEMKDLALAINKMQGSMRNIIEAIAENAQNVANASEEFSAVSQQISANSEETSAQANTVTTATEQVNRGLQTIATSTEEMTASIKDIAKNATEAAKVADSAMKTATETNAIVAKLGESSAEIGQVIKVITSIAQKTDLLALNATVEAARAGEVGAGFAVVANEVKELAKQTANATEDISRKIEAIQADAKSAVAAIASITSVIGMVNDISGTIATAVEEQSATTAEMSRNVSEAARGAGEVSQNIQGVAQAAQSTSQGATDSEKASKNLAEMSTRLRELVARFKLHENGHTPAAGRGTKPGRRSRETEEAHLVGAGVD